MRSLLLLCCLTAFTFARAEDSKTRVVEGSFQGIEQGDYAHWQMRTGDGKAVSYFILRPDSSVEAVLNDPEKFVGRKCRVTIKTGVEEIAEAGGKTEIEQVVSVAWTD